MGWRKQGGGCCCGSCPTVATNNMASLALIPIPLMYVGQPVDGVVTRFQIAVPATTIGRFDTFKASDDFAEMTSSAIMGTAGIASFRVAPSSSSGSPPTTFSTTKMTVVSVTGSSSTYVSDTTLSGFSFELVMTAMSSSGFTLTVTRVADGATEVYAPVWSTPVTSGTAFSGLDIVFTPSTALSGSYGGARFPCSVTLTTYGPAIAPFPLHPFSGLAPASPNYLYGFRLETATPTATSRSLTYVGSMNWVTVGADLVLRMGASTSAAAPPYTDGTDAWVFWDFYINGTVIMHGSCPCVGGAGYLTATLTTDRDWWQAADWFGPLGTTEILLRHFPSGAMD